MIDHCAKVSYHQKQNVNTQDVLQLQTVVLRLSLKSFYLSLDRILEENRLAKLMIEKIGGFSVSNCLEKKISFKLFEMLKSFHVCQIIYCVIMRAFL